MKGTVVGTVLGAVAGFVVKRWMDKGIISEQKHIINLFEQHIKNPEPVIKSFPPSAIWICDHCKAMMIFQCSPEDMAKHIEHMKSFDALYCPECNELNVIDEQTRDILNWSENV